MQNSHTTQNNVTALFVAILIVFIICQCVILLLYFTEAYYRVVLYYSPISLTGVLINSAINGFIYFILNKQFRDALVSLFPCHRNDGNETIEMASV